MRRSSRRRSTQPPLCTVVLAVLCGVPLTALLHGDEWPRPPSGEVRLASGRVVDYTIHFDRNSLRDSLRVGDALIALTSSGALLRFELPAVRLVRERIDDEVACIGRGEGEAVLAGLSDGRICRVDAATLELSNVVKLTGAPQWFGWYAARGNRPAGLVVATRQTKPVVRDGRHWNQSFSMIHDLATGKTFALDHVASTFLLDRTGQFWVGADRGEWGGRVARIDSSKGTITVINPPPSREPGEEASWDGVYGFIELADGQVWAYGGTSHFGLNEGQITRVDDGEARALVSFSSHANVPQPEPDPSRPSMPITHILEEKGGLLVFSYSNVFRVDKAFKSWRKVATLEIQYRWGRPDAMGAYPAVGAIHPPNRAGEPYLLATIGDGYVLLDGQKAIPRSIPGQLGGYSQFYKITNTSEGVLAFDDGEQFENWRLGPNGWEIVTLAPPLKRDHVVDVEPLENNDETWGESCVLVTPGGMIYTVSGAAAEESDIRITARRIGGKTVPMGREMSALDVYSSFVTADCTLWNAAHYGLRRFQKGRWETVEELPTGDFPESPIEPITSNGPPWLLLDRLRNRLWRLDHGLAGENPRLIRAQVDNDGKALVINDGIPWSDGSLLLATDQGLRAYAPATGKLSQVNLPEPPHPATALVRDGLGRIWLLADKRLWLSESGARTPESFVRVPWVGRGEVSAIASDPQHADGVIAALGSRGVAFVRAAQKR
jgi:hypothetical protein